MKFRIANATGRMAISDNFTLAKFLAIVLVSTGHYFDGSLLWVPVSVGLFIFAFASGYFTSIKHTPSLPLKAFWIAKLKRLGPPLIVINLFLLVLFLIQEREGIWHPHTLLGITGLSGFLNWLGIQSKSPFGAGLWFMTVLLIFYLTYPLLAKTLKTTRAAIFFLILSTLVCTLGHVYASPPYMLWPTIFGFCLGVTSGRLDWQPKASLSIAFGTLALIVMLALNAAGYKQFNVLAIVLIAIASVALLLSLRINLQIKCLALLSGSILEIYFIHGYLFVRPTGWPSWLGYLVSIIIILLVALTLNLLAKKLAQQVSKITRVSTVK